MAHERCLKFEREIDEVGWRRFSLVRMARKTRIEFPGAVYQLLDRGDRREAIYRDETDRRRFLDTLGEVCRRTGWRVHAFPDEQSLPFAGRNAAA